jgi:hypothetical protein
MPAQQDQSALRLFAGLAIETLHAWDKTISKQIAVTMRTFVNSIQGVMDTLDTKKRSQILLSI